MNTTGEHRFSGAGSCYATPRKGDAMRLASLAIVLCFAQPVGATSASAPTLGFYIAAKPDPELVEAAHAAIGDAVYLDEQLVAHWRPVLWDDDALKPENGFVASERHGLKCLLVTMKGVEVARNEIVMSAGSDMRGHRAINVELHDYTANQMRKLTAANIGRSMVFLRNNEVFTAATVNDAFGASFQISRPGGIDDAEADDLIQRFGRRSSLAPLAIPAWVARSLIVAAAVVVVIIVALLIKSFRDDRADA